MTRSRQGLPVPIVSRLAGPWRLSSTAPAPSLGSGGACWRQNHKRPPWRRRCPRGRWHRRGARRRAANSGPFSATGRRSRGGRPTPPDIAPVGAITRQAPRPDGREHRHLFDDVQVGAEPPPADELGQGCHRGRFPLDGDEFFADVELLASGATQNALPAPGGPGIAMAGTWSRKLEGDASPGWQKPPEAGGQRVAHQFGHDGGDQGNPGR